PPGERTRCSQRDVHGLGARVDEAEPLDVRHVPLDLLRQLDRGLRWGNRARAPVELRAYGLHDGRRRMAEDVRAAPDQQVDVLVAVYVPEPGAAGLTDVERVGRPIPRVSRDAAW